MRESLNLCQKFGADANFRSSRLKANRITYVDRQALKALKPFLEKHLPAVVDEFYVHLDKFPEALQIVTAAGSSVEKLKKTNGTYFAAISEGEFG